MRIIRNISTSNVKIFLETAEEAAEQNRSRRSAYIFPQEQAEMTDAQYEQQYNDLSFKKCFEIINIENSADIKDKQDKIDSLKAENASLKAEIEELQKATEKKGEFLEQIKEIAALVGVELRGQQTAEKLIEKIKKALQVFCENKKELETAVES